MANANRTGKNRFDVDDEIKFAKELQRLAKYLVEIDNQKQECRTELDMQESDFIYSLTETEWLTGSLIRKEQIEKHSSACFSSKLRLNK